MESVNILYLFDCDIRSIFLKYMLFCLPVRVIALGNDYVWLENSYFLTEITCHNSRTLCRGSCSTFPWHWSNTLLFSDGRRVALLSLCFCLRCTSLVEVSQEMK